MRFLAVALVVLLSSVVSAQEIGTELEPVGPTRSTPPPPPAPPDDPYATTPVEPVTPEPRPLPPPQKKANNKKKVDTNMGPGASAGFGSIGVRASFGGAGALATGVASAAAPTVGLTFFATDQFAITADAGFGLNMFRGNPNIGFAAAVGMVFALRTPAEVLRPIVVAQVSFGKLVSQQGDDFALGGNVGGGAEYFFSQHFSVNAQLAAGLSVDLRSGDLAIFTFTPGVGATLYF